MNFETFVNQLDEGLIKTYPIDKVVSYVQRKLNLTDKDISINKDYKSYSIAVKKYLDQNIIDEVDKILSMGGYFCSFEYNNVLYYFKKFEDNIFDKLKKENKIKYFYHITPSKNDTKIQRIGLIPVNKNNEYNYPERIYLLSDENLTNKISFFKRFAEHLPTAYDYDAYFTMDNIKPEYLNKIYEIIL